MRQDDPRLANRTPTYPGVDSRYAPLARVRSAPNPSRDLWQHARQAKCYRASNLQREMTTMRAVFLTLLTCLLIPNAEAAKCRRGTQITYDYDPCPPGYTDITGQQYGEVYGSPPCTSESLAAGTLVCRLPKAEPDKPRQNEARQIWKEPQKPACREGEC